MTIFTRQSEEQKLSRRPNALVAYSPKGYAFAGQCVDMLWSHPINTIEKGSG